MLKESEWMAINRVLLELYEIEDVKEFREKTLKVFRMLIPYSKGYFVMFDEHNMVDMEHSTFFGMDKDIFQLMLYNKN